MQVGDKVYRGGLGNNIKPGVIVAKKWLWGEQIAPVRRYIVKDIIKDDSVVGILTAAFYGPQDQLHRCTGAELIRMPAVEHEEPKQDEN